MGTKGEKQEQEGRVADTKNGEPATGGKTDHWHYQHLATATAIEGRGRFPPLSAFPTASNNMQHKTGSPGVFSGKESSEWPGRLFPGLADVSARP
ncbi:hypothetical protein Ct61P_14034 [Colletotrichum tofieldiae]|nr:hypothetical protein Ct61P_14034 [Colletotrichum tofieldiae]